MSFKPAVLSSHQNASFQEERGGGVTGGRGGGDGRARKHVGDNHAKVAVLRYAHAERS